MVKNAIFCSKTNAVTANEQMGNFFTKRSTERELSTKTVQVTSGVEAVKITPGIPLQNFTTFCPSQSKPSTKFHLTITTRSKATKEKPTKRLSILFYLYILKGYQRHVRKCFYYELWFAFIKIKFMPQPQKTNEI